MTDSSLWEEVVRSSLKSDMAFRQTLRNALKEAHIDTKEFSKLAEVSESSLYKILAGKRINPRLSTYRKIIIALKRLEGTHDDKPFIAIIAARPTLDAIEARFVTVRNQQIQLKEYAATSIEEVIVAAVRAQAEGAQAIVCAPIVSTTVEKIARVPVSSCPVVHCKQPIMKAAEMAALKIAPE